MRTFLVTFAVSSLAPVITLFLMSYVASKSRKAEAKMDSVNFVVRESKASAIVGTVLIIFGCAMVAGILYLIKPGFWSSIREAGTGMTIFMGFGFAFIGLLILGLFFGLGALGVYAYFHKRLVVMDDQLIYYPYFKKGIPFDFKEITKVEMRAAAYGQSEIFGYSDVKRLFHVDSTNPGFTLLVNKLKQENVPFEYRDKKRK